ncbi:LCP family protein required for cell wall assembly [Catenulispora sp. EB89]|uniref:LCP family protein n=1 Tax=Catenulispora sp. EB89 TaxID=3156257 RepID=UPI0035173CF8
MADEWRPEGYGEDDPRQGRRRRGDEYGQQQPDPMPWDRAAGPERGRPREDQGRGYDQGYPPERGYPTERGYPAERGYAAPESQGYQGYDEADDFHAAEEARPPGRSRRDAGRPDGGRADGGRPGKKALATGLIVSRALAGVVGAAVFITTGSIWYVNSSLNDSLHTSDATNAAKPGEGGYVPKHLGNDINLLLVGLDSRKDMNGNDLPTSLVEDELHAGSSAIGGYNTNVLIFMHIPANGGKVTAYSIPRDSDVDRPGGSSTISQVPTFPSDGKGKIKEAYGDAKAYAETKLRAAGITNKSDLEAKSREVGREATIAAVQELTNQHVDHFAEVNLVGFYDIVKAIGNIQVCLKAPANDPIEDGAGTGINLPAGVSTIDAATALQFVRQRFHLPNGDLDRTHRQQAFLSSVMAKLRSEGLFGDLGKMNSLLQVVSNDIVIDKNDNWNVLDFAASASNLTGGNAQFITLPTTGTTKVKGEDALTVDPAAIKTVFASTFTKDATPAPPPTTTSSSAPAAPSTPSAPAPPKDTITVENGTNSTGLALKLSSFIMDKTGVPVTKTGNGGNIKHTVIRYGAGGQDEAQKIADAMGTGTVPVASSSLKANNIVVTVGNDFKQSKLTEGSTPTGGATSSGSTTGGSTGGTTGGSGGSGGSGGGDTGNGLNSGGAVDASSQNGIPCVY